MGGVGVWWVGEEGGRGSGGGIEAVATAKPNERAASETIGERVR
jgi:hypothetical protein